MATVSPESAQRPYTIGAVCRQLSGEFPDISISKIRYLEDQGLLAPRRTQGGYRLYGEEDLERLRTILRLQRDEFLPLRVIRDELTVGRGRKRDKRSAASGLRLRTTDAEAISFEVLCERAGVGVEFARELEDYGLIEGSEDASGKSFPITDVEIAALCARLERYGVAPRHLRAFRSAVDRESGLIEQIVAPSIRSRNQERRQAGLEELEALGGLSLELSQLLFWRALRGLART